MKQKRARKTLNNYAWDHKGHRSMIDDDSLARDASAYCILDRISHPNTQEKTNTTLDHAFRESEKVADYLEQKHF